MPILTTLIIACIAFLLSGCADPDRLEKFKAERKAYYASQAAATKPVAVRPVASNQQTCMSDVMDLAIKGKMLFRGKAVCAGCHGVDGKAHSQNPDVQRLNPRPTDLTDPTKLRFPTDAERYDVIRNGIPGTGMVAFRGHLTDTEIRLIIEYLEVLKNGGC